MDALNIYENYFTKGYDTINMLLDKYYKENKKVALWGAGLRGKAFLNIFDKQKKRISYVFDSDEKKIGLELPTGHQIVDYKENDVDIVIAANNSLEFKILTKLRVKEKRAIVLNIDNIILGNLSVEDVLNNSKKEVKKVRDVKIAGIVIAYNPDEKTIENIKSYAGELDLLYIHDNSDIPSKLIEQAFKNVKNVYYSCAYDNLGLCVPFNIYYKKAIEQGMDWFITFDQDSKASNDMISNMRKYVESDIYDESVGIVSPTINETRLKNIHSERNVTYYNLVIQSGAMHKLDMMKQVGDYDENLFIDQVDYEYCVRCRLNNWKIVRLNNAELLHNQQDGNVNSVFVNGKMMYYNKYSSYRYYYIYRNSLYCYDKYHDLDLIYGLECKNTLKKMEINVVNDDNADEKMKYIERAKIDYITGKMGKYEKNFV